MWSAMTSLWTEPAVEDPPALGRRDAALAGAVLVAVVAEAVLRPGVAWRPAAALVGCALAFAVLVRRTRPVAAVAAGFGAFAAVDVAAAVAGSRPVVLLGGVVVLLLPYSLLRWGSGREVALGLGVTAVGVVPAVLTDATGRPEDVVGGAAVLVAAAALGAGVRSRSVARRQLVEHARLQEREQLARELHDTVAHHVSAIAIQAQAGLVLARSSSLGGATEALETIDLEAARTLAEMRTMVGALRDRSRAPDLAPRRGIGDIEALSGQGPEPLGVAVRLDGDLTGLPPAVDAALYRVAQESVTNAQRHARGATRVEVSVVGRATDVRIAVRDNGIRMTSPSQTGGYGLVGMAERVGLLGGTFAAGPDPGGGWVVHAALPRDGGRP